VSISLVTRVDDLGTSHAVNITIAGPGCTFEAGQAGVLAWLDLLKDRGYFSVIHPAKYGREMRLCKNKLVPAGVVATARDDEYRLSHSRRLEQCCNETQGNGLIRS
jgi:hypothetical protein